MVNGCRAQLNCQRYTAERLKFIRVQTQWKAMRTGCFENAPRLIKCESAHIAKSVAIQRARPVFIAPSANRRQYALDDKINVLIRSICIFGWDRVGAEESRHEIDRLFGVE